MLRVELLRTTLKVFKSFSLKLKKKSLTLLPNVIQDIAFLSPTCQKTTSVRLQVCNNGLSTVKINAFCLGFFSFFFFLVVGVFFVCFVFGVF